MLATGGDSALGGDDLDHAIAEWIMAEAGIGDAPHPQQMRRLLRDARPAKEALARAAVAALTSPATNAQRDDLDAQRAAVEQELRTTNAVLAAAQQAGDDGQVVILREKAARLSAELAGLAERAAAVLSRIDQTGELSDEDKASLLALLKVAADRYAVATTDEPRKDG